MINLSEVIIQAARVGNAEVINESIYQKADINAVDEKGYTPLIVACYNNRYESAKLLLELGADVNAQGLGGYTALMGVAKSFDRMKSLIQ